MPKLRQTDQQRRELAMRLAIARAATELGLELEKDRAAYLGMAPNTHIYHKAKNFQGLNVIQFGAMARKYRFTGREVCAIFGVPYEDPAKDNF